MANKYNAKTIMIDGQFFPSHREAEYYLKYKGMLERGEIVGLDLQPRFELIPAFKNWEGKKIRPCHYTADFMLILPNGKRRIVEVKGFRTRDYALRRKMFEYKYPQYEFEEVR